MFIGYALDSNVSHFLIVNSEIGKIFNNTVIKGRDVYFENIFSFKSRVPSDPFCIPFASDIRSFSSSPPTDTEPRKSKRTKIHKNFREFFLPILLKVILAFLKK